MGGGGTAKGAAGARWGRGGEGEMHLSGRGSRPEQPRNLFFFHNLNNFSTIHSSSPAMHRLPVYAAISMHKNTLRCHVSRASCIEPRAASDEICHLPLVKLYMRHTTRFSKDLQKKTGS